MAELKAVCYINQFYAGLGGEEMAHEGLHVYEGAKGPGVGLEGLWGGEMKVVKTIAVGDNFFNTDESYVSIRDELISLVKEAAPDVIVAGPAFNAGRYGVACGKFCELMRTQLHIPTVSSMFPSNPAVEMYVRNLYILEGPETAAGMRNALPPLAKLALKLAKREKIQRAAVEGYIPTGRRNNELDEKSAAERVVDLWLKKYHKQPYRTEIPLRKVAKIPPAPAIRDASNLKFALITTGGLVPKGNPDKIRQYSATSYGTYAIDPATFNTENYESVHGGYDTTLVNQNIQRLIPYKAAMQLQKDGVIGEVAQYFLSTCGIGTNVGMAMKLGADMAAQLKKDGVQAVILTST